MAWLSAFDESFQIIELAHPLSAQTPVSGSHAGFTMALKRRHGDAIRDDGGSGASEIIITSPHIGTHIDALAHASFEGKLHGDIDAAAAQQNAGGFSHLGAETIPPMVCRGALIDLPSQLSELQPGYEVTADDLERASQGIDLDSADVILIRTGWAAHWSDAATYVGVEDGVPGIGVEAAGWLAARSPIAVGSDTMAFDCIPAGAGHRNLPAHSLLLVQEGIYIIENLNLEAIAASEFREFLFILAPLPIVGATGSPVRPLALVRNGG